MQDVDIGQVAEPHSAGAEVLAVGRRTLARLRLDLPDAHQPGEGDLGDLELVVPAQDQADGLDQHLREQGTGREPADADPALQDENAAQQQQHTTHDQHVAEVDGGEEHGAQPQGPALPGSPLGDPALGERHPRREPSRCVSTVLPASTVSASAAATAA